MGLFSLFYPTGTTNLLFNPSVENNLNGWSAINGTIARTDDYQSRGAYAVQFISTGITGNPGVISTGTVLTAGITYTFSADILIPSGYSPIICFNNSSGVLGEFAFGESDGNWQRLAVSWTCTGTATYKVGVRIGTEVSLLGVPLYFDGFQLEAGPQTSYCDGDTEECYWNGARHNSTSTRPNSSTLGGIEKDLEDSYGLKILVQGGMGLPSINNLSSQQALQPGAFYQGFSIPERVLNFVGAFKATSKTDLHSKRQAFINAFKPGNTYILKYKVPAKPLLLKVVYDSGLEFGKPFGNLEKFPLRMIAYEPYWYEEFQQGSSLTPQQTFSTTRKLIKRDGNGNWSAVDTGLFGSNSLTVYAFARGLDNTLYIGGDFQGENSPTNKVGFSWYKNGTLSHLDPGITSPAIIYTLLTLPNGKIFIGGSFGTIGGVTTSRAALFNPDTSAIETLATGSGNNNVYASCLDGDGNLIVGGDFTQINGQSISRLAKCNYITKTWTSIGNPSGTVHSLVLGPDGNVYMAVDQIGLRKYDGTSITTIQATSADFQVWSMLFDKAGLLYMGGSHTGTIMGNRFSSYNGNIFSTLGNSGLNGTVFDLEYDEKRNVILVAGIYTTADNQSLPDGLSQWNGSVFTSVDIDLPGTPTRVVSNVGFDNTLTLGFNTSGSAITSAVTELSNRSTAPVYPIFEFSVSGSATATRLYQIRNEDTNQTIYLNVTIQPGETVILDLSKKTITSSYRGNIIQKVLKGSNFASFALTNNRPRISMFADKASLVAKVYWVVQHYSADGSS